MEANTTKGVICYFSSTGNTKLACEYIVRHSVNIRYSLFNIVADTGLNLDEYEVVGFATFADYLGPQTVFTDFIRSLPRQSGKRAFAFNTFGLLNGGTLKTISKCLKTKGFDVFAHHALHMPESIATMIVLGLDSKQAPNLRELEKFKHFAAYVGNTDAFTGGQRHYKLSLIDRISFSWPRWVSSITMGAKKIDGSLCTKCGLCIKICPYQAISMHDFPVFDQSKCHGCYGCYNRCPPKAIYTKMFRGKGHYREPPDAVKKKLAE
jgi:ferredoxin/flavodoxin